MQKETLKGALKGRERSKALKQATTTVCQPIKKEKEKVVGIQLKAWVKNEIGDT